MSRDAADDVPWQRLSSRVVVIDVVVSVLSLLPGVVALVVVGVEPTSGVLWPLGAVAFFGVAGAVADLIRWSVTRFRVTDADVERRTGLFVRRHRRLHLDRVRSVDTEAKLRHRLAGLRVVTVGAGQQQGAGESALVLDALSVSDAAALRRHLLDPTDLGVARSAAAGSAVVENAVVGDAEAEGAVEPDATGGGDEVRVLATLRPWWVVYNMIGIWAYLMAAGLLWGGYWFLTAFGVDVVGFVTGLADWERIGWVGVSAVALLVTGVLGALGLGVNFLLGYGRFELARVRTGTRSDLRTRRGLLSTREVSRDESRMRGLAIGEPVLWRWIGMADTNVITTGLSLWDTQEPTAILPRGPIAVARTVAREIFGTSNPFDAPLARHPRAALRRRLWWATAAAGVVPLALAWPAVTGAVPGWLPWAALGAWPVAVLAAVVAYRALGHAIAGEHVVLRSGMLTRSTVALRRDAVSTIAVRQSVLQRRLGLCTVSAMTAAGWSVYEAPDVAVGCGVGLAGDVAPGLLDGLLEPSAPSGGDAGQRRRAGDDRVGLPDGG